MSPYLVHLVCFVLALHISLVFSSIRQHYQRRPSARLIEKLSHQAGFPVREIGDPCPFVLGVPLEIPVELLRSASSSRARVKGMLI
jgi:hypothetical protein